MDHIVTVSCRRDLRQLVQQIESIELFVTKPIVHWVIFTDLNVSPGRQLRWMKLLYPLYRRHILQPVWPEDIRELHNTFTMNWMPDLPNGKKPGDGWKIFQPLQFTIYDRIKQDYLVLNTKNLFVKPTDLSSWDGQIGCGQLVPVETTAGRAWEHSIYLAGLLGQLPLTHCLAVETPAVVRYNTLKNCDLKSALTTWYRAHGVGMFSDWVFYSYLERDNLNSVPQWCPLYYSVLWSSAVCLLPEQVQSRLTRPAMEILGVHRQFLQYCTDEQFILLNQRLQQLGFKTLFKRPKLDRGHGDHLVKTPTAS